ncbi:hypothetical protein [Mucilaginibacter sp. OK098]|uniref:hypothetical protein n=1 Tax=Mucilaginibacter sp. OK098 TaxID=1855297 RepID=UPI00091FBB9E|nr:hypothetical protein [Mucilaginibacter sp. OK098]SHL96237.1 hypothetical protein SAMN05216524_101334 [Mucilaginibacter sp. OK098]
MKAPFSREELYEHIWSKPVSKLEAELSLSNWDIKQWCKKLEVPLPPVGHWSRIQFGKPVERIPLQSYPLKLNPNWPLLKRRHLT